MRETEAKRLFGVDASDEVIPREDGDENFDRRLILVLFALAAMTRWNKQLLALLPRFSFA